MNRILLLLLLSGALLPTPLLAQGRASAYPSFIWDLVWEGMGSIRYGNWTGDGWWGGSTDDNRVGMLAPIDSLDAVAQRHDLGYKVADALGAGRPLYIAYYRALADEACAREAANLSETPAEWPHPPTDANYKLAKKLRSRLAIGFGDVVKNKNAIMGALRGRWNKSDDEEIEGLVSKESFAVKVDAELTSWSKQYSKWQLEKAAKGKNSPQQPTLTPISPRGTGPTPLVRAMDINGTWTAFGASDGGTSVVRITTNGEKFHATSSYTNQGKSFSWTMDGTIDPRGKVDAVLIHSAATEKRHYTFQLSTDGKRFSGADVNWVRR